MHPRPTPRPRPTCTGTMPDVGGVVHTHSPYATAWAARAEAVPCVLTMCADEFGGEIPVGPFGRHRRRLDRPGHRRDARRPSVTCSADAEPWCLLDRPYGARRRQGRRDVRGRRSHHPSRPSARRAGADPRGRWQCGSSSATRTSTGNERTDHDRRAVVPHRQPEPLRPGDARPGGRAVARHRRPTRRQGRAFRSGWSWKPVLLDAEAIHRRDARRRRRTRAVWVSSPGCTPSPRRRCGSPVSTP